MKKNILKLAALAFVGVCFALVSMKSYSEIKQANANVVGKSKIVYLEAKKADGTDKSFADVIGEFKGKVVYVDFWASWCRPCREEFVHAKKLHAKLGDKPVVFLYISLDSSEEAWKEGAENFELEGYHFYPNENQRLIIGNQFQINGIPRYVLIDRNGKMVNADASRPSSNETLDAITKLL